jgi:hypothetical protein
LSTIATHIRQPRIWGIKGSLTVQLAGPLVTIRTLAAPTDAALEQRLTMIESALTT